MEGITQEGKNLAKICNNSNEYVDVRLTIHNTQETNNSKYRAIKHVLVPRE